MNREEKLSAIYKEMANKELTFGCKVKFSKGIYSIIDRENVGFLGSYKRQDGGIHNSIVIEDGVNSRCYSIEEIIGHPVMIGDVLDYISKIKFDIKKTSYKLGLSFDDRDTDESKLFLIKEHYYSTLPIRWLNLRKPIEYQSDECIDYVYNLI